MHSGRCCHVAFQPLVDAVDGPAVVVDSSYRILTSNLLYRDAFAGGMPVEGECCYKVSHQRDVPCGQAGESCPLDHARNTRVQARSLHVHSRPHGNVHEEVTVHPLVDEHGTVTAFVERHRLLTAASASASPGKLVGRSAPFMRMLELVTRGAPSQSTILLLGESGTGKERVARVLHSLSERAAAPFFCRLTVRVSPSRCSRANCSATKRARSRGRSPGSAASWKRPIEPWYPAKVGDVPLTEQVKLLRLLETGIFRRVGGIDELRSDFRLLCATNRNLGQMVETGSFRRDLYFRISAFPIHLPPLRERRDDIPVLVDLFLKMATGHDPKRVSAEALAMLEAYEFPGNVRELHNLIERACLLADGDELLPEHFPDLDAHTTPPPPIAFPASVVPLAQAEHDYLTAVAARFQGSRLELASVLGISPRTLYRKLQSVRPGPARGACLTAAVGADAAVASYLFASSWRRGPEREGGELSSAERALEAAVAAVATAEWAPALAGSLEPAIVVDGEGRILHANRRFVFSAALRDRPSGVSVSRYAISPTLSARVTTVPSAPPTSGCLSAGPSTSTGLPASTA